MISNKLMFLDVWRRSTGQEGYGGVGLAVVSVVWMLVRSIWTLTIRDGAPILSSFRAREPPYSLANCHVGFMSLYYLDFCTKFVVRVLCV